MNARPDAWLRQALTTAREVLSILKALDQRG